MSEFQRCETCGKYDWADRHVCPPMFLVRKDDRGYTDGDCEAVHARDHEEAAEVWAERYDSEGDYTIVSGRPVNVYVWPLGNPEDRKRMCVTGESVPQYSAEVLEGAPENVEAK